ncbi:MAG: hypothetical protein H6581_01795 [Bacteroidia bacterium]|nr:hypothetical protein [Bacteroidia bacterium]
MKKRIHVGLDFGTHQTKACARIYFENPFKHEFLTFDHSFFIPSRVRIMEDETLLYGAMKSNGKVVREFSNFKMAAAIDESISIEFKESEEIYSSSAYSPFTPEFISVLFLTYSIFKIENLLIEKYKKKDLKGVGFFNRLFVRNSDSELEFTWQMGIPTEYTHSNQLARKRKFETILLMAHRLKHHYQNLESFQNRTIKDLQKIVESTPIQPPLMAKEKFESLLNETGISVFPEAAAGLMSLLKLRALENGFYSTMDIGGGSTDITFFSVWKGKIYFLASESFEIASNNVFKTLSQLEDDVSLENSWKRIQALLIEKKWTGKEGRNYQESIKRTLITLQKSSKKLFAKNVKPAFNSGMAVRAFKDQACFMIGGGSALPYSDVFPYLDQIRVWDNGRSIGGPGERDINLKKKMIGKIIPDENVRSYDGKENWQDKFQFLSVAYGLSYPFAPGEIDWDESEYNAGALTEIKEVAHPFNENMFSYRVVEKKWAD